MMIVTKHLSKNITYATVFISFLMASPVLYAADPVPTASAPLSEHSSVKPSTSATPNTNPVKPAASTTLPDQPPVADDNKIAIVNRPLIAGLWEMNIPNARCKEYYNFMENGEVVVKSGAEWTYGNYVYQLPALAGTGTPILAMKIKYDNLETDCSGNAIDQRGEEQQQFVKWLSQSSIEFCATEDGKQCFADLRRISP
jgi:hypothetical protein